MAAYNVPAISFDPESRSRTKKFLPVNPDGTPFSGLEYVRSLFEPSVGAAMIPDDVVGNVLTHSESITAQLTSPPSGKGVVILYPNNPTSLVGVHYVYNEQGNLVFDQIISTGQELSDSFSFGRKSTQVVELISDTLPGGVYALSGSVNAALIGLPISQLDPKYLTFEHVLSATGNASFRAAQPIGSGITVLTLPERFETPFRSLAEVTQPLPVESTGFTPAPFQEGFIGRGEGRSPGVHVFSAAGTLNVAAGGNASVAWKVPLDMYQSADTSIWMIPSVATTAEVTLSVAFKDLGDKTVYQFQVNSPGPVQWDQINSHMLVGSLNPASFDPEEPPPHPCVYALIEVQLLGGGQPVSLPFKVGMTVEVPEETEGGTFFPVVVAAYSGVNPGNVVALRGTSNFELIPDAKLMRNVSTSYSASDGAVLTYVKKLLAEGPMLNIRPVYATRDYLRFLSLVPELASPSMEHLVANSWGFGDLLSAIKTGTGVASQVAGIGSGILNKVGDVTGIRAFKRAGDIAGKVSHYSGAAHDVVRGLSASEAMTYPHERRPKSDKTTHLRELTLRELAGPKAMSAGIGELLEELSWCLTPAFESVISDAVREATNSIASMLTVHRFPNQAAIARGGLRRHTEHAQNILTPFAVDEAREALRPVLTAALVNLGFPDPQFVDPEHYGNTSDEGASGDEGPNENAIDVPMGNLNLNAYAADWDYTYSASDLESPKPKSRSPSVVTIDRIVHPESPKAPPMARYKPRVADADVRVPIVGGPPITLFPVVFSRGLTSAPVGAAIYAVVREKIFLDHSGGKVPSAFKTDRVSGRATKGYRPSGKFVLCQVTGISDYYIGLSLDCPPVHGRSCDLAIAVADSAGASASGLIWAVYTGEVRANGAVCPVPFMSDKAFISHLNGLKLISSPSPVERMTKPDLVVTSVAEAIAGLPRLDSPPVNHVIVASGETAIAARSADNAGGMDDDAGEQDDDDDDGQLDPRRRREMGQVGGAAGAQPGAASAARAAPVGRFARRRAQVVATEKALLSNWTPQDYTTRLEGFIDRTRVSLAESSPLVVQFNEASITDSKRLVTSALAEMAPAVFFTLVAMGQGATEDMSISEALARGLEKLDELFDVSLASTSVKSLIGSLSGAAKSTALAEYSAQRNAAQTGQIKRDRNKVPARNFMDAYEKFEAAAVAAEIDPYALVEAINQAGYDLISPDDVQEAMDALQNYGPLDQVATKNLMSTGDPDLAAPLSLKQMIPILQMIRSTMASQAGAQKLEEMGLVEAFMAAYRFVADSGAGFKTEDRADVWGLVTRNTSTRGQAMESFRQRLEERAQARGRVGGLLGRTNAGDAGEAAPARRRPGAQPRGEPAEAGPAERAPTRQVAYGGGTRRADQAGPPRGGRRFQTEEV